MDKFEQHINRMKKLRNLYEVGTGQHNILSILINECETVLSQSAVMRSIVLADLKKAFEAGQEQKRAEDWSYNAGYDREHPRYDKAADVTFDDWLKQYFA